MRIVKIDHRSYHGAVSVACNALRLEGEITAVHNIVDCLYFISFTDHVHEIKEHLMKLSFVFIDRSFQSFFRTETKLEKIITQKYIAHFPYSFGAWTDLRRTGYPKLFPVLNADEGDGSLKFGDIIRRAPFPDTDDASVADIEATGLDALGGEDYQSTRLWWDVDAPNF